MATQDPPLEPSIGPKPRKDILFCLFVLLIAIMARFAIGGIAIDWFARMTFLVLCAISLPVFQLREALLLVAALACAVWAWLGVGRVDVILSALDLAAFFGAFIAALTAIRDVAARSGSILALGRYLLAQPPQRRFWATAMGGHGLGAFLNFGAVSLMSPLIQESVKDENGVADRALEQRQLCALIRGFSWILLWAPTMLTQAVVLALFPTVQWGDIAPVGIATAIGFIALGWLTDRIEWRHDPNADTVNVHALPVPWQAVRTLSIILSLTIAATILGSFVLDSSIAVALMFVSPALTFFWFLGQQGPTARRAARQSVAQLVNLLGASAPGLMRGAVTLGLSGFIGRVLGQTLPVDALSDAINLAHIPGWLLLASLPVLISLGGQIALSPILMVVLLGDILNAVPELPTGPEALVLALTIGWSLSMALSPNATATLLISATTRIPPTVLTWRWNLRYGLLCYACALPIFALIA